MTFSIFPNIRLKFLFEPHILLSLKGFMTNTTHECLLSVARKLFGRFGFKGVSVRQICDAADVNQAAISYHFKGKEELYRHCLEEGMNKDLDKFAGILTPAKNREDMEAKLGLFLQQFYDHMSENADVVKMVVHEMNDPSPIGIDIIEKISKTIPFLLMSFLEQAKADGVLHAGMDPKSLNSFLCSQVMTQILFEEKVKRNHGDEWGFSNPAARKFLVNQIMLIMSGGIYAK
jgi:AcrR family transcriptional regulator